MFDMFQNMYQSMSSEYKRVQEFSRAAIYFEPQDYFTGHSFQYGKGEADNL